MPAVLVADSVAGGKARQVGALLLKDSVPWLHFRLSSTRGMGKRCVFCRTPTPDSDAAILALVRKRVDAKDPSATNTLATGYCGGFHGLQQDIPRAIELWTEASDRGHLDAQFKPGGLYYTGDGGLYYTGDGDVEQDEEKALYYWQHAAIQGHPEARHVLGMFEGRNKNHEMAIQHYMISVKMGGQDSLNKTRTCSWLDMLQKHSMQRLWRAIRKHWKIQRAPSVKRPMPSIESDQNEQLYRADICRRVTIGGVEIKLNK